MSESEPRLPEEFVEVLDFVFDADRRAVDLFQQFLTCRTYSRSFALLLIEVALGNRSDSWEVRRLATLMLQEHLLSLCANNTLEFRIILKQLGLEVARDGNMPSRVLKEGYSCRDLPGFIREFRRKLARPRCAVRPRRLQRITTENVREFALQSRQECKLVLARYMFLAEEVVAQVHRQVKRSTGIYVAATDDISQSETNRLIAELPDYEAAILRHANGCHGLLGGKCNVVRTEFPR